MSACRSCGADLLWVASATTGKPMPLDAKPEKRVVLSERLEGLDDDAAEPWVAEVVDTYTPHFATCPEAREWRRS